MVLLFLFRIDGYSQYKINHNSDEYTTLRIGSEQGRGFNISFSLVALFTAGTKHRDGLRIGGGVEISQRIDNWRASLGLDILHLDNCFKVGTTYAGLAFDSDRYRASYIVNKYHYGKERNNKSS